MPNWCSCILVVSFETTDNAVAFSDEVNRQVEEQEDIDELPQFHRWYDVPNPEVDETSVRFDFGVAWAPNLDTMCGWLQNTDADSAILKYAECGIGFVGKTTFTKFDGTLEYEDEEYDVYSKFHTFARGIMFNELEGENFENAEAIPENEYRIWLEDNNWENERYAMRRFLSELIGVEYYKLWYSSG